MKVINKVKYYVKVANSPKLAINVYQTDDGKFHRFIAVISNKNTLEDKTVKGSNGRILNIKSLVSPKKLVTEYLNEFADSWINNGFKSDLPKKFSDNITEFIREVLLFAYGFRGIHQIDPIRYKTDVKLSDWEFRMFYKPKDIV